MKKTDKILVTGASGFIGSRLIKMLYELGYTNLRATSWSRDLRNDFEGCENIEHIKGNLQDADFCEVVSKDCDVVIHAAANTSNALDTRFNPLLHVTPNIEMNVNLMPPQEITNMAKVMWNLPTSCRDLAERGLGAKDTFNK